MKICCSLFQLIELWGADVDFGETLRDPDVDIHTIARAMLNSGQVAKVDGTEVRGHGTEVRETSLDGTYFG